MLSTFGAKFLIILILFVISFAENVKDDDDAYEKVVENITELTSSIDVYMQMFYQHLDNNLSNYFQLLCL